MVYFYSFYLLEKGVNERNELYKYNYNINTNSYY